VVDWALHQARNGLGQRGFHIVRISQVRILSFLCLFVLQISRLRWQHFRILSRHVVASATAQCALRLGLRDGAIACEVAWAAHFSPRGSSARRARFSRFGLSAKPPLLHSSRHPQRLTVRSSRRRILASLKVLAARAILAPHCRVRRGLTQALAN
jgi:hypothetical protein